jgi:uncharacterized protein YbjT (DUF2867 family)
MIKEPGSHKDFSMKIILTGATGTAGSEVLRQALADKDVTEVLVLSRRPLDIADPKLRVAMLENFLDYATVVPQFAGYDACLWCLGISQTEVGKEEYETITCGYAIAAAQAMKDLGDGFRFCFLSGRGADSAEKSSILFARIKGKTENALTLLGRPKAWHFRPGYIHPITAPPRRWLERLLAPLTPFFYRFLPSHIISTVELAKAMLYVAKHGSSLRIIENDDIREISRRT